MRTCKPCTTVWMSGTEACSGVCGKDGRRASYTIGFKGRVVAEEDKPVQTFVKAALARAWDVLGWSSEAAAEKDFDAAIDFLKEMRKDVETKSVETEKESATAGH